MYRCASVARVHGQLSNTPANMLIRLRRYALPLRRICAEGENDTRGRTGQVNQLGVAAVTATSDICTLLLLVLTELSGKLQ